MNWGMLQVTLFVDDVVRSVDFYRTVLQKTNSQGCTCRCGYAIAGYRHLDTACGFGAMCRISRTTMWESASYGAWNTMRADGLRIQLTLFIQPTSESAFHGGHWDDPARLSA